MAIQCGRCHCYHESVADVRACANGQRVAVVDSPTGSASFGNGTGPTDKQWAFLNSLRVQAGQKPLDDARRANMTKRSISEAINDAKIDVDTAKQLGNWVNPNPASAAANSRHLRAADYPSIPAGYYAVLSMTGTNDLDFLQVDVPDKGNWVGFLFVKRVLGGGTDGHRTERVQADTARTWMRRLNAEWALNGDAAIVAAQALFGQSMGYCGKCGRELTNDQSRERGIGPDCWARMS
jgi:hypothetical protein